MAQRATAILVLGMHRSGTSALTRVLNLCGVELGTHLMAAAEENNPSGFWEHLDAVDLHERLLLQLGRSWSDPRNLPEGWLESPAAALAGQRIADLVAKEFAHSAVWAVKDPRLCRFVPLWTRALGAAGIDVRFVFALRHPGEVAASLSRRDGIAVHEAGLLLLNHFFEAALATVDRPRCVVTYQALMDDWRGCIARIGGELGLALQPDAAAAEAIDRFLDRDARTHHAPDDGAALAESLNGRVYRLARDSADSAAFWRDAAALGEIWDLYRNDLLPYVDDVLDLLAVRHAIERSGPRTALAAAATPKDGTPSALARLQFRMISGLQDGIGRLGQASADLGAMVRTGTEAGLAAASSVAASVDALRADLPAMRTRLDTIDAQTAALSAIASQQQALLADGLAQADVLRRHADEVAARSAARFEQFAGGSDARLTELIQAADAAAGRERELLARIDALNANLEALVARERQRDEARWSRRLRRLLSRG